MIYVGYCHECGEGSVIEFPSPLHLKVREAVCHNCGSVFLTSILRIVNPVVTLTDSAHNANCAFSFYGLCSCVCRGRKHGSGKL